MRRLELGLLLLLALWALRCGEPAGDGGTASGGAAPTGGANTGGAATGGAATGGQGTGGLLTGGVSTGGIGTGGVGTGGVGTGGASTGGLSTGGLATGGLATGGLATGGLATGGAATGGAATGGAATGGASTGGEGTGGLATGGLATGGAATGGAATGGEGTGGEGTGGEGTGGAAAGIFRVYLLIGQSNMAGGAQANDQDRVEDERIRVLGYDDCAQTGRQYNQWDLAAPPLHACWSNGIGPGDHFAKTLIEALPDGDTIGLVPCGIPGVDIDFFRKGVVSARRDEFVIPPDDHWDSAYDWVIERARIAQADGGVIDGILFHQGESDSGQVVWLDKVSEMVADLRADLGVGEIPFVAGELLYGGACEGHNVIVNQLPDHVSNAYVVSAAGLAGVDSFHFDSAGYRTLGARYAEAMIGALGLVP